MWTREQRYAAAKQICFAGEEQGIDFFRRHPETAFKIAVDIQCELNAVLRGATHTATEPSEQICKQS
jgi:hypothetical protein